MRTQLSRPFSRWALSTLMALSAILVVAGVWFYQSQKEAMREVMIRDLTAVAQLKVDYLAAWRSERLSNADLIMDSIPMQRAIAGYMANPHGESRQFIHSRFSSFQANYNYADIVLVDPSGAVVFSLTERTRALSHCCLDLFFSGLQERRSFFTHIYPDPLTHEPYVTAIGPLFASHAPEAELLGAVLLISNAREHLYSQIQSWPIPSDTAEAYIIERDGDDALIVSDLLQQPVAALTKRIPLEDTFNPAVAAVLGHRGIFEGVDYRGVNVVAAMYPVPDSSWFIVVKKDAAEIFSEWRFRAFMISALLTALILCLVGMGALFWQRDRNRYYQSLYLAEVRLRASIERHSIILQAIGDAVIATDASGRIELLNPVAEVLTGWSEKEAQGRCLTEVFRIVSEETREVVENPVTKVLREGVTVGLANHTLLLSRDGRERPIADSGAPIRDEQGNISGVVLVFRDQTEERRVELELRASEARFRGFVENVHDVVYSLSTEGIFTYISPNWRDFLGEDAEPPLGQLFEPYIHPDDLDICREFIDNTLTKGAKQTSPEYRVRHSDGSWRWHVSSGSPVYDDEGRVSGLVGIARDVTERISLQDQLLQSQRVEAVGRLAGGVAHDFNNMLGVIIGNAELALAKASPDDSVHDRLKQIVDAAKRSAEVTRQLLAFARKQTISPQLLDLNASVEQMLQMLQRLLGEDIDIAWRPSGALWSVRIDPSQLDQILANLCVNARDAIDGVGKLTIETGNVRFDEDYCAQHIGFIPGDYVLLAVSDNGCGMDKDTCSRIFEPFFTTKKPGKGTGLGLATVYGIVKQNHGFINVYSEEGKGTTFRIYLPRQSGEAEPIVGQEGLAVSVGRGEVVLLVEDDQAILELVSTILVDHNYKVLLANTPSQAINVARQYEDSIDLMITDVVMPEMNGRDLAGILQALQPQMKVLFMSGYTANVIAHHGVLDEGVDFIQKPFSVSDFAAVVQRTLKG